MNKERPAIGRVPTTILNVVEKGFFQAVKSAVEYLYRQIDTLNANVTSIEAWHEVGLTGEPAYQNGWTTTSSKHFGFRKLDAIGCVHIHGRITPGTETTGTVIFALPDGYEPLTGYSFMATTDVAGAAGARIYVDPNGNVTINNADTGGTFYDVNIIFPLDV
jgi:hypothetical protein